MATDVIIDPSTGQIYWNDSAGVGTESISIKGDAVNTISFTGYSASFSPGSTPAGALTLVTIKDSAGTDALIPGTSGYNLGSATLRWNTFATNADLSGTLVVSSATNSSSTTTGALKVSGGVGIVGNAFIGGTINVASPITIPNGGTNASSFGQSAGFIYYDGTSVRLLAASGATINYTNGYYQFDNRVYATSFFANNAQMPNGSGIAGRVTIWSGNNTIGSDAEFTYDSTSNILNVSGNINAIGFTASGVAITSGTASTSTTTGALVVAGGVGISGRLTFNQAAFGTTGISTVPTMAMIGQTGDPIFMSVLEDNSISFEGSQGQLFSISPNLTTGYIWSVNDISGVPFLRASVGGTIGIAEFGGVVGIGQTNPKYKLDLKGSFGLASSNDALYNFIFNNSAASGSNNLQIRSANSILFYNSGNTFYTGFKSNASADKLYVLPATDGSSGQFLQTDGAQNLSWATATGSGGTGSTAGVGQGAQYEMAYYPGTGLSVVGSNTFKNNTVTGVVSITHATVSTNFGNGALTVSGGVGIGGSLYVGGIGASIVGVTFSDSIITRGTWNATAISSTYGGTGLNNSGQSGILKYTTGTGSLVAAPTGAIVGTTDSQNLTNKTYNSVTITAPASSATLTLANLSSLITSGGHSLTFNTTATTSITLPTTGTLATTSNKLSDFAATTSLELLNTITGETGSGALVFATSPEFTTSVTTPSTTFSVFNATASTINAFGAATLMSIGAATGKATFNSTDDSSSTTTGALAISGGAGIAKSVSIGGRLQIFNGANFTAFVSSASGNTVYTLPAASPATGSSVLQSTSAGVMSWVPMVASSSGAGSGTVAIPDAQYRIAFYAGTGASVSSTNLITAVGTGVTILGATNASSATVAALSILGGLGVTGNAFIGGTINVASTSVSNISNVSFTNGIITSGTWSGSTITAFYGGTGLQGPTAIGDLIVANTATTWSRYATSATSGQVLTSNGTGNAPTWQAVPPSAASSVAVAPTVANASFFVTAVNTSNSSGLGLSTITSFVVNPSNGIVSLSGLAVTNTTASTNTTSGALIVSGGLGLAGNAFIGGTINVTSTSASVISGISFVNGAITVGAWNSTLIAPQYGGTGLNNSSATGLLQYSSGTASVITTSSALANIISDDTGSGALVFATSPVLVTPTLGVASASSINKVVFTTPTTSATLTLVDGSTLITSGANSLTLTTTATTNATFPSGTKTLVATDVTSLASLNTVGVITSGTWSGSTITAFYGGTGLQGPSAIGDLIVANTATTWSRYATSATSGQVLTSNGTGNAPTWQAVPPSAASSVAITPTIVSAQFFIPVVNSASSAGLGLSSVSSLVINPFTGLVSLSGLAVTNTTVSTSTSTGALVVTGGVGIGGSLYTSIGSSSSVSGVILANGNVSATTYNKLTLTAPATSATLTLANGSSLITSGGHSLTFTTSNTTSLTLPTTGTLATTSNKLSDFAATTSLELLNTITGETGSGALVFANTPSLVTPDIGVATATSINKLTLTAPATSATLTLANGSSLITSGGHSLTFNTSATTSLTLPTTGTLATTSNKLSDFAATTSLELLNTITGETGSGALVFATSPDFTTSVTTGSGTFALFNATASTINAFGAATLMSIGAATGKATFNSTDNSISATTGGLVVSGGAGVAKSVSIGGRLQMFNGANYTAFVSAASGDVVYTLPPTVPAGVGSSYLSASTTGVMAWVAAPTSGGSATPGGNNSSNTFAGASGFEYTTGGTAVTVSIFSPSGTGYTSGLWISAIGGTVTRVGIGLSNPQFELEILGEISATNKSFVIDHPTKDGMKLRYGSLEGPENGVYVRGELKGTNIIEVPDHWIGLVHKDSYTVHLTPIGRFSQLYVEKIENYNVFVADTMMCPIHCYYSVWAERKDIPKLVTEYEAQ
jgi:hypothetical protein